MSIETQTDDFRSLMRQVGEGSESAAWTLVETYGPYILRTIRRMLHVDIRSKFDSTDFVQAVWASFFSGRGDLRRLETPEQLVAYLTTMARNKLVSEVRRRTISQKYNVRRERPLVESGGPGSPRALARDPTPSEVAVAREQWERMLHNQPPHYRSIIRLRLCGETYDDIAEQLQLSGRTVQRVLKKLLREQVA